jgi:LssY C-terminus
MSKRFPSKRRWLFVLAAAAILYLALAYVVLPALWSHHEHEPGLASLPMVTRTSTGIPGDALNVGLVGDKEDVLRAMHAAGWFPADPITLRSSVEIVGSVVLDRPYHDAPVSPLFYDEKRNSWLSRSRTAEAPTSDITSASAWSLKKEQKVVRSGSAQSLSTVGSA